MYQQKITELGITDPNTIPNKMREDDIAKWPAITLGHIFSYIWKKDFDADYIGKYKDQRVYSFFDSGFIGPVLIHNLTSLKHTMFVYCEVGASQSINENRSLWIVIWDGVSSGVEIFSAWCSCMAGAYAACNHIIATLYKIEYASNKGWCTPARTEVACQWNKSSKKIIEPTGVTDLFIWKRLRADDWQDKNREKTTVEDLQILTPELKETVDLMRIDLSHS